MPVQFRLYIVRHGETEWNKTRRIQGQLDVPLNKTGLKQAMMVADALRVIPFERAISSDLQRAYTTAKCILRYHPDTVLEQDESIRERYMGELQGEFAPSKKPAPSTENMASFARRCLAWYLKSIVDYMISAIEADVGAEQPHNILVVSHGAWIATLLSSLQANRLLTCDKGVEIGRCLNTGVSIIEYPGTFARKEKSLIGALVRYSAVGHLIREDLPSQEVNADVLEGGEGSVHETLPLDTTIETSSPEQDYVPLQARGLNSSLIRDRKPSH